jgi:inorganic triphosphatase YgiF
MSVSVEREIKLLAPESFELPPMGGVVPGLAEGVPVRIELDATYYDTEDLSLARAGVTLRHRTGEPGPPWTVKLPESRTRTGLTRLELRFEGEVGAVPAEAREMVRAYVRARPLSAVARLHTRRTSVALLDADGDQVAELVDDLVAG